MGKHCAFLKGSVKKDSFLFPEKAAGRFYRVLSTFSVVIITGFSTRQLVYSQAVCVKRGLREQSGEWGQCYPPFPHILQPESGLDLLYFSLESGGTHCLGLPILFDGCEC